MKLFVWCLLLLPTITQAQSLSFKGLSLGTDKAATIRYFHSLDCKKTPPQFKTLGEEYCTPTPSDRCTSSLEPQQCQERFKSLLTFGGSGTYDVQLIFVDDRFEGVNLNFPSGNFDQVVAALEAVYGPGLIEPVTMSNRYGQGLQSRLWMARSTLAEIAVNEFTSRTDGHFSMRTAAFKAWAARARTGNVLKNSADL